MYVTVVRHRVSQLFTLLCVYMYSIVIITFPGIGVYCMSASVALLTVSVMGRECDLVVTLWVSFLLSLGSILYVHVVIN